MTDKPTIDNAAAQYGESVVLTDEQIVEAIRSVIQHDREFWFLTFEDGPYDIDTPTPFARRLAEAFAAVSTPTVEALRVERAGLRKVLNETRKAHFDERDENCRLKQQLAASQQRVRELEVGLKDAATDLATVSCDEDGEYRGYEGAILHYTSLAAPVQAASAERVAENAARYLWLRENKGRCPVKGGGRWCEPGIQFNTIFEMDVRAHGADDCIDAAIDREMRAVIAKQEDKPC